MSSRKVVVDIETIPCPDALRSFIPPSRPSERPAFWRRWFSQPVVSEEPYLQTALNWTLGRIICIGLLIERENRQKEEHAFLAPISPNDSPAESLAKEAEALRSFWQVVLPEDYFIGHNILGFDLPFLWNRSLVCNVCPSRPLYLQRESTKFTFDTMQVWAHWPTDTRNRQFVRLGVLTQIVGLRAKSGAGSQVYDLWRSQRLDQIRDYCLNDVRLEYDLYCRLTLEGKAPRVQWNECDT
jgi:hypothetical protein